MDVPTLLRQILQAYLDHSHVLMNRFLADELAAYSTLLKVIGF